MYLPECEYANPHEEAGDYSRGRKGMLSILLELYSHKSGADDGTAEGDRHQKNEEKPGEGSVSRNAAAKSSRGVETAVSLLWREKASALDKESLLGVLGEALAAICELRRHKDDTPRPNTSEAENRKNLKCKLGQRQSQQRSDPVVALGDVRDNLRSPMKRFPLTSSSSASGGGVVISPSPPNRAAHDRCHSPSPRLSSAAMEIGSGGHRFGGQQGKEGSFGGVHVGGGGQKSGSSFRRAVSSGRGQLSSTASNLPLPPATDAGERNDGAGCSEGEIRTSFHDTPLQGSACEGLLRARERARESQRRAPTNTTDFDRCVSLSSLGEVLVSESDVHIPQSSTGAEENSALAGECRRLPQCLPISSRFVSRTSSSSSTGSVGVNSANGGAPPPSASVPPFVHSPAPPTRREATEVTVSGGRGVVGMYQVGSSASAKGPPLVGGDETDREGMANANVPGTSRKGSVLGNSSEASVGECSDGDHASSSYGDEEHPLTVARRVVSASVPIIGFGFGGGVGGNVLGPPPPAMLVGVGVLKTTTSFSYFSPSMPMSGMDSTSAQIRYRMGDDPTAFPFPPPPRFSPPRPAPSVGETCGVGSPTTSHTNITRSAAGPIRGGGTTAVPSSSSTSAGMSPAVGGDCRNSNERGGGSVSAKKEVPPTAAIEAPRSPQMLLADAWGGSRGNLTSEDSFASVKQEASKDTDLIVGASNRQGHTKGSPSLPPAVLQVANSEPPTSNGPLLALSRIKHVPTTAIPPGTKSSLVYVPLRLLHFYQDYVCNRFIDGRTIRQTIDELREGRSLTEKGEGASGRSHLVGDAAPAGLSPAVSKQSLPSNEALSLPCPKVDLLRASDLPNSPQKQTTLPSGTSDFVVSLSNRGDTSVAALLRVHNTASLRTESEEENTLFFNDVSLNSHNTPLAAGFLPPTANTRTSDIVESPAISPHSISRFEYTTTGASTLTAPFVTKAAAGNDRPIINTSSNGWPSAAAGNESTEKAMTSPASPRVCTDASSPDRTTSVHVQPMKVAAHTPYSLPIMDAMFWRGKWYGMGNRRLSCYHFVYADSPDTLIPVLGTHVLDEDQLQPQGSGIGVRVGGGLFIDGHCYFTMGHCLHSAIMRKGMVLSSPPSSARSFSTPRGTTPARISGGD